MDAESFESSFESIVPDDPATPPSQRRLRKPQKCDTLACEILSLSVMDIARGEFLARVAGVLAAHSGLARVDICLREKRRCISACSNGSSAPVARPCAPCIGASNGTSEHTAGPLCSAMLERHVPSERVSVGGTLHLSAARALVPMKSNGHNGGELVFDLGEGIQSALLVPFAMHAGLSGLLVLRSRRSEKPWPRSVEFYQSVAHLIGVAIAQRSAQRALRERVKEVTYLYRITELLARPGIGIDDITQLSPQLVAHGCPVPRPVTARVLVDDREAWWPERRGCAPGLASHIIVQGRARGRIEVRCGGWQPEQAETWEREAAQRFLDTVAGAIATVLQRWELRAEKEQLQAQVQHAERLATIGTLVAVLAHEVNEPLNAIHGFTDLVRKDPSLAPTARADLDKVITASEHVQGVVGKLLSFGRASEPSWQATSLNQVVEDALCFIAPSCTRAGVRIVRRLDPRLGELIADREQLCQIVVNLGTNAIRAMPNGGVLTVATELGSNGSCLLLVEDTGVGISDEVREKMFQPFFTTHSRHRGLGLGLTVVHGIVTSHGGSIDVESQPGCGTRMKVSLPVHPVWPEDAPGTGDGAT